MGRITNSIKRAVGYPISATVGGGVGYVLSLYPRFVAKANVRVRPELANADFITAFFSDHASHWVFYHYGNEISVAAALIAAGITTTVYHYTSKQL